MSRASEERAREAKWLEGQDGRGFLSQESEKRIEVEKSPKGDY